MRDKSSMSDKPVSVLGSLICKELYYLSTYMMSLFCNQTHGYSYDNKSTNYLLYKSFNK